MLRESSIMFFSGEALFLSRRDDVTILDQCGGTVMIVRGNSE